MDNKNYPCEVRGGNLVAFVLVDLKTLAIFKVDVTSKALVAEGVSTLTQIRDMSDDDLAALAEKVGAAGQHESQEWKAQAEEMISGKPPRAKVDQDLLKKMLAEREGGEG